MVQYISCFQKSQSSNDPFQLRTYNIQSLTKVLSLGFKLTLSAPQIYLLSFFLQEMAHFNPNSFLNNVLVPNKTAEKHFNIHSLVKPTESDFGKTKVLSLTHKREQKSSKMLRMLKNTRLEHYTGDQVNWKQVCHETRFLDICADFLAIC